ncbi:TrmH family RNA methyltransferase [Kutzneria albida]|uniref:tRNA/rRNA methyltransferase SpoU type domain-containing protein n=1 Tax=Kutzneria albida DSM 43870 TaxID=1449976 RepID=W5WM99_9PSEU|nr:TrmH family RNA methyltransferase [Kutzneria albida]AHI01998.1 hypothetical protein KALB_8641 [Kutzneria albida DSM 43870]
MSTWARTPGSVVLEGFHPVKHALRFGAEVEQVVTTDLADLLDLATSHAPDLYDRLAVGATQVDRARFTELVGRPHPTGTAGLARRPHWDPATVLGADRTSPAVLLDHPRNLGNLGAVVRVAAGLGAAAVLSTGEVDPWHPTVLRGSAGLHFALPVGRLAEAESPAGTVIAFDADGEDLRGARIPDNAVLAFGSERHGLSERVRARADRVLSLPMRAQVSSYNLTTSVAMALYHWTLTA